MHAMSRASAGEWTDEASAAASIKLMCTHCYERARDRNRRVPLHARGKNARLTEEEQRQLFTTAYEDGRLKQADARDRWHISKFDRWDFDRDARTLTFWDPSLPRLIADVRLVGSFSNLSNTFQWSWVLFPDGEPMTAGISYLRAFGEVRGLARLGTDKFPCDEVNAGHDRSGRLHPGLPGRLPGPVRSPLLVHAALGPSRSG